MTLRTFGREGRLGSSCAGSWGDEAAACGVCVVIVAGLGFLDLDCWL